MARKDYQLRRVVRKRFDRGHIDYSLRVRICEICKHIKALSPE